VMALNPFALYSAAGDCHRSGMVRLSFSNIPTRGFPFTGRPKAALSHMDWRLR
jgi:hypothetical protein